MKKITWRMIYVDFQKKFPNLKKNVSCWRPHDYATICLYTKDGKQMLYNYDTERVTFIE